MFCDSSVESFERQIFSLKNQINVLSDELYRYRLLADCYESYVRLLDQMTDQREGNEREEKLKKRLIDIKSCFSCEIDLRKLRIISESQDLAVSTGGEMGAVVVEEEEQRLGYGCDVCAKRFVSREHLRYHKRIHRRKEFKCAFIGCHYETYCRKNLVKHGVKHSQEKHFRCTQCDAKYKFAGSLAQHQLREHPTLTSAQRSGRPNHRFRCDVQTCAFVTPVADRLAQHRQTDHPINAHVCHVCGKGFAEKYLMTKHVQRFKGSESLLCFVDNCLAVFHTRKLLDRHVTAVHDCNALRCHFSGCDKEFRNSETLRRHKLTHDVEGNAKYACDWSQCGKKFLRKEGLAAHKRTHTGERPFACEWPGCDRRFAQENNLYSHRLLHKTERRFHCDYPECKYKTNCKFSLKRHTSVHTGERPHRCEWPGCEFRTAFQHNLKIHRIKVHKIQEF